MPTSPAKTPRRAVAGEFIHFSENEQRGGKNVEELDQVLHLLLCRSRFLNIFSMRSVIRKPLTMLVIAAVTAMKPSTREQVVASSAPVIRMAPTTEMAEIALVSDISGVCSSGETLRMISRPTKVRQHENV